MFALIESRTVLANKESPLYIMHVQTWLIGKPSKKLHILRHSLNHRRRGQAKPQFETPNYEVWSWSHLSFGSLTGDRPETDQRQTRDRLETD